MTVQVRAYFALQTGGALEISPGAAIGAAQLKAAAENATHVYAASGLRTLAHVEAAAAPHTTTETTHGTASLLAVQPYQFGARRNLSGARIYYHAEDAVIRVRWYSGAGVLQATDTVTVVGVGSGYVSGATPAAELGYIEISLITGASVGRLWGLWITETPLNAGDLP